MVAFNRKYSYSPKCYKSDYFVIKHLQLYLTDAIARHLQEGMIVGDIGCGEQPMRDLVETHGSKYYGIDISQNNKGNVDIIASIDRIPLPDNFFDCIICTEVLEHVPDVSSAFNELTRLIRNEGYIILTTPFCYPLHEEPYDFRRLSAHFIKKLAMDNNLEIVELRKLGNELEAIATLWCNIWRHMGDGNLLMKFRNVVVRLPVNILVILLNKAFQKIMPTKMYLNTACILRKKAWWY